MSDDEFDGIFDPVLNVHRDITVLQNTVLETHGPAECRKGLPCTIHSPSGHHMRTWPQAWDPGSGMVMRVCKHDATHPDPDDLRIQGAGSLLGMLRVTEHDCCPFECCIPEDYKTALNTKMNTHAVFPSSKLPRCGADQGLPVVSAGVEPTCAYCRAILRLK
jgi:hypothetical protein